MVLYIHGNGGNPAEADHYKPLYANETVIGFDYSAQTPWEAKEEFPKLLDAICPAVTPITVIANSIGAYFTLCALSDRKIEKAFFISPVVDMQKLIGNMMAWANVSEAELKEKGTVETDFGQTLSWEYLTYVKDHPIQWNVPTHILYGGHDDLTSMDTIRTFAERTGATLTVMENGEHWFHTKEQMDFLDGWIRSFQ